MAIKSSRVYCEEAEEEVENPEFPAFDENQLPSIDELDQKKAKIDAEEAKKQDKDEPSALEAAQTNAA